MNEPNKEAIAIGALIGVSIALIIGLSYALSGKEQPAPGAGATDFLNLLDSILSYQS